jgi:peptide deformylase
MMYKVRIYGDPILRKPAEQVSEFDEALSDVVSNMIETLFVDNGLGLAAPQVGILKRIVVIDLSFGKEVDNILTVINPDIYESEGESTFEEGCLSVPGVYEDVVRPAKIRLRFQDMQGKEHDMETDGFLATVIQHELDHLNGILFIDRLSTVKKSLLAKTLRELAEGGVTNTCG